MKRICKRTHQRSCRAENSDPQSCGFAICNLGELCGGLEGGDDAFDIGSPEAMNATPVLPGLRIGSVELDLMEVSVARFRQFWRSEDRVPSEPIEYPNGAVIEWEGEVREPVKLVTVEDPFNWTPLVTESSPDGSSREHHPINGVDWWTALAFCVWDGGRLPTEAEWEWFARYYVDEGSPAPRGRRYTWGNEPVTCSHVRHGGCPPRPSAPPMGTVSNAEDVHLPRNQAGNVAEWTADAFQPYDAACWNDPGQDPLCVTSDPHGLRTVRGASYADPAEYVLSASRRGIAPETQSPEIGFRCVRDLPWHEHWDASW